MEETKTTTKEVKNVLFQYRNVRNMIMDLEDQIEDIDRKMISVKSQQLTGMPRGGKPFTSADWITDKLELEARKKRFEKIGAQKKEIVQTYIDTVLSPRHNRFLTSYFIKCLSVYEIARKEHYTKRHAFRIYSEALEMVDLSLDL